MPIAPRSQHFGPNPLQLSSDRLWSLDGIAPNLDKHLWQGSGSSRRYKWTPGAASLAGHLLVLLALFAFPVARQLSSAGTRTISVDLVSSTTFNQMTAGPANSDLPDLEAKASPIAEATPAPADKANIQPVPAGIAPKPSDGMTEATDLLAGNFLRDPANREVRDMLPRLDPYERTTQLCSIEALEQVRLSGIEGFADAVVPSAFGDTAITGPVMEAPKGAYRSDRNWFAISFQCTIGDDLESVIAFKFHLGSPIPKNEWESHNLIAEDFDDD